MSLKLYRKREDGVIDSGWFEPEESRKKRDNGWVTNPDIFNVVTDEEPIIEIPVKNKVIKPKNRNASKKNKG